MRAYAYPPAVKIQDPISGAKASVLGGGLRVMNQNYLQAVAEGDIAGHALWRKTGYHPAAAAAETTLWNLGTQYVFPTAAISVEAISTSTNDTSGGSAGAKTIYLEYLDSTYAAKTFTFNMNGQTAVAGPTDFFRVNSFDVSTGTKSAGVISLRLVGGAATVYSQIPVGGTISRNSVYTVPLGKMLFIQDVFFSAAYSISGKTERVILHTSCRQDGVVITTGLIFFPQFEAMLMDSSVSRRAEAPIMCHEKADIKVSVIGETNAIVTSELSGWIE